MGRQYKHFSFSGNKINILRKVMSALLMGDGRDMEPQFTCFFFFTYIHMEIQKIPLFTTVYIYEYTCSTGCVKYSFV